MHSKPNSVHLPQLTSSSPLSQSFSPSHFQKTGIHWVEPAPQLNSFIRHVLMSVWKENKQILDIFMLRHIFHISLSPIYLPISIYIHHLFFFFKCLTYFVNYIFSPFTNNTGNQKDRTAEMFGVLLQSLKGQNVPLRVQLTAGAVPMNDVFYRDIKKDQFKLRWLNCLRAFVSRGKNARLLYMGLGNDAHHVYVMNKNTVI